jgi:maltooligosyltrehalose trehalohydrolase
VAEIADRVHAVNASALVIAESGLNDPRVIRPRARGGWECDAQWADEFHHALRAVLTGEHDGYYADFGSLADLAKAFARPFVYDGQYSAVRRRRFGAPAGDRAPEQFIVFDQNHDQIGNRAFGDRLAPQARPLAAFCTLLSPFTPMLFMGEEYGENAPFQFFTDHIDPDVAQATRDGRRREFASFAAFGEELPDPQDPQTFARSRLTRQIDGGIAELYRDLLRLRRTLSGPAEVQFDEQARWLRARRAGGELVCNFASEPVTLPIEEGRQVVLATHRPLNTRDNGTEIVLPPLAGILVA